MFQLSVCAETVFPDLPFIERMRSISQAGFLVEFWRWLDRDLDEVERDRSIKISAFTGYIDGSIVDPDGAEIFLEGIRRSIPIANRLQCKTLFISTGELGPKGEVVHAIARHPARRWISAYKTLCSVAELAEAHDLTFVLEHLNTKVDHAGFPLPHVEDAAELVSGVDSPRIRLLLDVYHAQIEEGNLVDLIADVAPLIGYVHVADVPGRHEPGTGEINYPRVVQALKEGNYAGTVGLEAYPEGDTEVALARFSEVFGRS
jgi:hydroxypyruvate isomerase